MRAVLLTVGDPGRITGGYLFHLRMAELAPLHGARLDFVSLPERPFPLAALAAPAALDRAQRLGAHALVLDSIAAAFVGPWVAAQAPRLPLVGMLHQPPGGIDHGPARTLVQGLLDRLAYRRARLLMVASEALAAIMQREGVPESRLRVVLPGRDAAAESVPPSQELRRGRRAAFLCVANWVARKGIVDLLDAFASLDEADGTLHLVGDEGADARYARLVHARLNRGDLAARVVVHGPLSRERVAGMYRAADVFVLPSVREPYGTVYGEAMSAGLPVVGWRAGNLPYLVGDGAEGMLTRTGDLDGLAGAMRRLAVDESLRERLGAAARRRADTLPTWDETAEAFFRTIRETGA